MKSENIDPALKQQLDEADDSSPVEAYVVISPDLGPEQTATAIEIIRKEITEKPEIFDSMESIGVIRLRASADTIRQVLEHDEIAAASSSEGKFFVEGDGASLTASAVLPRGGIRRAWQRLRSFGRAL